MVSILILGQAKTADDQPRYAQCGLYRLPSELLLYLMYHGALKEHPAGNPPLQSEAVDLTLPQNRLEAQRWMSFWSLPATSALPTAFSGLLR